jgi:hypothetical protein
MGGVLFCVREKRDCRGITTAATPRAGTSRHSRRLRFSETVRPNFRITDNPGGAIAGDTLNDGFREWDRFPAAISSARGAAEVPGSGITGSYRHPAPWSTSYFALGRFNLNSRPGDTGTVKLKVGPASFSTSRSSQPSRIRGKAATPPTMRAAAG